MDLVFHSGDDCLLSFGTNLGALEDVNRKNTFFQQIFFLISWGIQLDPLLHPVVS